jgi:hypothetical protein
MSGDLRSLLRLASIGLAAGIAVFAAPAGAAKTPIERRTAVGVELRWWSTTSYGSVFPIEPFFHYEVTPNVFLDADLAVAPQGGGNSFGFTDSGASFGLGNPTVGVHYASSTEGERMTWFAGVRIGLPLAQLGGVSSDQANDLASAANAHGDFYRWVPELLPLVGRVGFDAHPSPGLWIRLPLDLMILVPTTSRRELKGGMVARFEIEGQSTSGVGAGGALQLVISNGFRTRDDDPVQMAMEPYFVFDNDRVFVRFGLIFALDRPLGPAFNEGGLLATDLQIGGHLR